ncbi:MAG: AAA family ATPase [Sinimarinibacterium sp.]|jgi:energy-coupling factor transporter ATP-binding protein EcfA2
MKLTRLTFNNFKRFRGRVSFALTTKLVALVGPNEAGKSTVLEGLQLLSGVTPLRLSGPSPHATRGEPIDGAAFAVEGVFELSAEDQAAIAHLTSTRCPSCVVGRSYKSPDVQFRFPAELARTLSDRHAAARALSEAFQVSAEAELPALASNTGLVAAEILASTEPTLAKSQRRTLSTYVAALVERAKTAPGLAKLASTLQAIAGREETKVEDQVGKALAARLPPILMFTADDRDLKSEYELSAYFREKDPQPIPIALRNLALVSGLDLQGLYQARVDNDTGGVRTRLAAANERLSGLMRAHWSQADVSVQFDLNGHRLSLLVENHGTNQFSLIATRSDGLRQYVALMAFLMRTESSSTPPVLLMDEIEHRLHYDAQADLIQMLSKQRHAQRVVYTTHSVGCLSEDLGTGVKVVAARDHFSTVENSFWASNRPGISPLLFGMGALTLAFLPIRYAVISEGPTEMLLLPTLLREVLNQESLGFQVIQGLSVANKTQLARIENEAPTTVYVVDNDNGGRELRQQLRATGVPDERILSISTAAATVVIEDFINPDLYLTAMNTILAKQNGPAIPDGILQAPNVAGQVRAWCANQGIEAPGKIAVAYQLLELKAERDVVLHRADCRDALEQLNRRILTVLSP